MALLVVLAQSQPGYPPSRERVSRFRFEASGSSGSGSSICVPNCVAPQYCSAGVCANPQFSFATVSGVGMTAECAGTALNGVKGETITFTRASSAYCTIGNETSGLSNSSMVLLTTDQPRAMRGGDGSGAVGLMMERATTNFLLGSEAFNAGAWSTEGTTTITADQAVAPNGATTADRAVFGASNSGVLQTLALGVVVAGSIYVKGNGTSGNVDFAINNGTAWVCANCAYVSTTWSRCVLPNVNHIATVEIGRLDTKCGTALGATDVFLWGGDVENGNPGGSSYVPTTTVATGTRAPDINSTPYAASGSTLSTSATVINTSYFLSGKSNLTVFFDSNNRFRLNNGASNVSATETISAQYLIGGVAKDSIGTATFTGGTALVAGYYDATNMGACVNGVCKQTAFAVTLPTGAGFVTIGNSKSGTGFEIGGVVKNVCVDPTHCASYGQ